MRRRTFVHIHDDLTYKLVPFNKQAIPSKLIRWFKNSFHCIIPYGGFHCLWISQKIYSAEAHACHRSGLRMDTQVKLHKMAHDENISCTRNPNRDFCPMYFRSARVSAFSAISGISTSFTSGCFSGNFRPISSHARRGPIATSYYCLWYVNN